MRILYVATVGGFMPFFKSLVKKLIDSGNVVDFAANQNTSRVPDYYKEWGCKVFDISCSRSPFSLNNIKAIREIRRLANNYDIIHCHTPLAGMATRIACRKMRKKQKLKVIYTAHGFHFYRGSPKKNWIMYYPIEKLCSRYTDLLITITKEDYQLAKKKMKANHVEYVPGVGVDINKFSSVTIDKSKKRNEIGVPSDAFMILSVGELNDNKNHEIVINALSKLKDNNYHYVIAGVGKLKDKLLNLAISNNVNLHLLGWRNDVGELYKIADCYCLPSKREGLNVSIMEAMTCGLPVICGNIRGNVDLIDKDGGILCKTTDADSFALAITNIKNISGVSNVNKVKEFSTEIVDNKILSLYKRILNE